MKPAPVMAPITTHVAWSLPSSFTCVPSVIISTSEVAMHSSRSVSLVQRASASVRLSWSVSARMVRKLSNAASSDNSAMCAPVPGWKFGGIKRDTAAVNYL
eukprot:scaffold15918_cov73-Phaeocystis_antarctica.AAC.1